MKLFIFFNLMMFSTLTFAESMTRRDENKVIKCAMKIVESRRLNQEVANGLVTIFHKVDNQSLKQCEDITKISKRLPKVDNEVIDELFPYRSEDDQRTHYIREALRLAAINDFKCEVVGAEVDVQLLVGLGGGLNVGQCTSYSGKRFAVVAPEITAGAGLGAYALFDYTEFTIERNELIHFADERTLDMTFGMGYAVSTNIKSSNDEVTTGYGVGFGLGLKSSIHIPIRLIPMGRTYKHLRINLELDQVDGMTKGLF